MFMLASIHNTMRSKEVTYGLFKMNANTFLSMAFQLRKKKINDTFLQSYQGVFLCYNNNKIDFLSIYICLAAQEELKYCSLGSGSHHLSLSPGAINVWKTMFESCNAPVICNHGLPTLGGRPGTAR